MVSFFYDLKGQATLLNGLVLLLLIAFLLNWYKRRRPAVVMFIITILLFIAGSTSWLPDYLALKLESKYPALSLPVNSVGSETVLIVVLGSGYDLDQRLPPNAQLGLTALGRLAEGIRISRTMKNGIIVCSGFSSVGLETQAQVTRRAAIVLGVDSNKLATLNKPSTTAQEAVALGNLYEKDSKVIIVTDALHMDRAIKLFRREGFDPMAAPTNYRVKKGSRWDMLYWWPSMENIALMNYIIHEYLGTLKASV